MVSSSEVMSDAAFKAESAWQMKKQKTKQKNKKTKTKIKNKPQQNHHIYIFFFKKLKAWSDKLLVLTIIMCFSVFQTEIYSIVTSFN